MFTPDSRGPASVRGVQGVYVCETGSVIFSERFTFLPSTPPTRCEIEESNLLKQLLEPVIAALFVSNFPYPVGPLEAERGRPALPSSDLRPLG